MSRRAAPGRHVALLVLVVLTAGCVAVGPLTAPEPGPSTEARVLVGSDRSGPATGTFRVAVPAEPTAWIVPDDDDLAAADLASLWALPLYRVDAWGRVVRALAADETVSEDGRSVTISLAPGAWSDGTAVGADDVVATVAALRGTPAGHELDVVAEVVAEAQDRVRFELTQPTVRWQLLLGPIGVLPAHVLEAGGLEAAAALEVTGGSFVLQRQVPGLGATFAAHPGSPLGGPSVETLEVVVVPSYDVALGLLDRGELDGAIGHLAVGAVRRASRLGLEAAAPVGGTWVGLRWAGTPNEPGWRGLAGIVDVSEQVEGLGLGETLSVPGPALDGGGAASQDGASGEGADPGSLDATLVVPAEEEALVLTGRLLEAQVAGHGGRLRLRRERTPEVVEVARAAEAALVVRRDPQRVDLARDVIDGADAVMRSADAWPSVGDPVVQEAVATWTAERRVLPLYRPGVGHVWRPGVEGFAPSAWPGAGFASAVRWHVSDGS